MRKRQSIYSFARLLVAGVLALGLVAGLTLLLSRLEVRAKQAMDSAGADAVAAPSVLTPTSQTRSPARGLLIERTGSFTISGVAWLGNNRPPFPGDPVLRPIDNGEGDENYVVDWSAAVSGTYYVLYEAENQYFEDRKSVYSGTVTEHFVSGQSDGTYYYRVKSYNTEGSSRWSNVESVTVGSGAASTPSRLLAAAEPITVLVRIDAGAWQTATVTDTQIEGWDGWDWSYEWSLPEDEQYQEHVIDTRASADGTFGPTDTITVTVNNGAYYVYLPIVSKRWPPVPREPVIEEIDNADGDDSYVVRWSYEYASPEVITFTLQEATQSSFADAVDYELEGDVTSKSFSDKGSQTYYYRIKGRNTYGDGPWSAVRSVTAVSNDFYDDFTDPNSGWRTHDDRCCLDGCDRGDLQAHPAYKYNLFYEDGKYHVKIPLDCRAGGNHGDTRHIYPVVFAPDVERSDARACIEAKGTFERWNPYWSFWGLVFAASDDKSTVWSLEVNNLGDWGVVKRTGYDFPGPNAPFENEDRSYEVNYIGGSRPPARAAYESNTLRVEIEGNNVKLYINGEEVHQFSNPEIESLENVGLIGGDWELTPTQIGYDYFYYDEGCDDY